MKFPQNRQTWTSMLGLVILLLLNVYQPTHAQALARPAHVAAATCNDGTQASGAIYRICMPTLWNGKLIVYAHGYVAPNRPVGIPEDQLVLPGASGSVTETITGLGYAFAMSSYRANGLAVQEGVADLVDVVQVFKTQQKVPTQVLLIGVSEGGLITTLALEQHPDVFNGGLALCGPYGSFVEQTNYFGDFRVLFDYFFPGLLPPTAVDVPPSLLDTWETTTFSTTIQPVITDPANADKVAQLLQVAGAAYDANNASSKSKSIEDILWYNIFATNDAKAKLGGQPFTNQDRQYTGSADDLTLNQTVARFAADAAALQAMTADETTGQLSVPLVTMHTTGDPIVPYRQAEFYQAKVNAANRAAFYVHKKVTAYGHCQFSSLDIFSAFNTLIALVDHPPLLPRAYLALVMKN